MLARFKGFKEKYPYYWVSLYFVFYMIWFAWVESRANLPYHVIHFPLDDYIPFCEYFVIPYILWFGYIAVVYLWLFFHDKSAFFKYIAVIYTGMTLFLIICTIYPNGLTLRQSIVLNDNVFSRIVDFLQKTDTCTNVLPSIHAYNSIGCMIAILKSNGMKSHKILKISSVVLTVLIIMSTMFLKQHSVIDVASAVIMSVVFYFVFYLLIYRHRTATKETQ